jgi:formamidopyrimidine-DNA glycosylase
MPEGPEVRRHADALDAALGGETVIALEARTRAARAWLEAHPGAFEGRRVESVRSHGKHIVGRVEDGLYFHSHFMMWGRWLVEDAPPERDRRERARIVTARATAVLRSAPIFEVGEGDPYAHVESLATLGPDALPYDGRFDEVGFRRLLLAPGNATRPVGAALLDQRVVAGIGNYLRAEILFACRLDPWRAVGDLSRRDVARLARAVPEICRLAYERGGRTVPDDVQSRMRSDPSLVYNAASEWGTRHYVFRRTNLPCLECGDTVRQLRQPTGSGEGEGPERIVYFCPTCQGTTVELKKSSRRARPRGERTA